MTIDECICVNRKEHEKGYSCHIFRVDAQAVVNELEATIARVRALHTPFIEDMCFACSFEHSDGARTFVKYPCPTIQALDEVSK